MFSATKSDEFHFCVHSLFGASLKSRLVLKIGFVFQSKNSFSFYTNSTCASNICLFVYQPVLLKPGYLEILWQSLSVSRAEFLYLKSFKSITWKGLKAKNLPGWSPERLLSNDYLSPLVVFNRANFESVPAVDYQFILRKILDSKVEQIDLPGLVRLFRNKSLIQQHKTITQKYLAEIRPLSVLEESSDGVLRISNKLYAPNVVSIVIPTRGAVKESTQEPSILALIRSLAEQNLGNSSLEVVVVYDDDNDSEYLTDIKNLSQNLELKLVKFTPPFNFSKKCNVGAKNSSGQVIIFLNDDTTVLSPSAVTELSGTAMLNEIGAVGAKLYFPNNSIQHAGIFVMGGNVGHAYFKQINPKGPYGDLSSVHEVTGVTGACLAQRKEVWESLGGWDLDFSNSYNDVEYCFRIRENGYRILQNNLVELIHYESLTRDPTFSPEAKKLLESKWISYLNDDLYFPEYVLTQNKRRRFRTLIKKILRKLGLIK